MYGTIFWQVKFTIFSTLWTKFAYLIQYEYLKKMLELGETELYDLFCKIIENRDIIHSVHTFSKMFKCRWYPLPGGMNSILHL